MINSCKNVYHIGVTDDNNWVDNMVHDQIKQLVRQSVLMMFRLGFYDEDLEYDNYGFHDEDLEEHDNDRFHDEDLEEHDNYGFHDEDLEEHDNDRL